VVDTWIPTWISQINRKDWCTKTLIVDTHEYWLGFHKLMKNYEGGSPQKLETMFLNLYDEFHNAFFNMQQWWEEDNTHISKHEEIGYLNTFKSRYQEMIVIHYINCTYKCFKRQPMVYTITQRDYQCNIWEISNNNLEIHLEHTN